MTTIKLGTSSSSASDDSIGAVKTAVGLVQNALTNGAVSLPSNISTITVQFSDTLPNNALGFTPNNRSSSPIIYLSSSLNPDQVQAVVGHELAHIEAPGLSGGPAGAPGTLPNNNNPTLHDLISQYPNGVDTDGDSIFGGMYKQNIQRELTWRQNELESDQAIDLSPDAADAQRIATLQQALSGSFQPNGMPISQTPPSTHHPMVKTISPPRR